MEQHLKMANRFASNSAPMSANSPQSAAPAALDVAFLGLGVMGGPMAGHLAKAGHRVTVYNRTASRAEAWVAANGGTARATPRAAAERADIVFACVGNDDDLRQVTVGQDG